MSKQELTKTVYDNIVFKGQPLVYISKQAWDKIKYLCKFINTVEWSGCIFYRFVNPQASIIIPDTLNIEIVDLIPLDKGTTGYTEYTFDARVLQYMTEMNYFDLRIGHIHSHHSMKTFFSGTDMEELNENSEFMKPYLSLIVNNFEEFSCRLAARVNSQQPSYSCQDINNNLIEFNMAVAKTVVAYYECKVIKPEDEINVSPKFIEQYNDIVKRKAEKDKKISQFKNESFIKNYNKNGGHTPKYDNKSYQEDLFGDDWDLDMPFASTTSLQSSYEDSLELSCYILRLGRKVQYDTLDNAIEDAATSMDIKELSLEDYVHSLVSNIRTHINNFYDKKLTKAEQDVLIEDFCDNLLFDCDPMYAEIYEEIVNAITITMHE